MSLRPGGLAPLAPRVVDGRVRRSLAGSTRVARRVLATDEDGRDLREKQRPDRRDDQRFRGGGEAGGTPAKTTSLGRAPRMSKCSVVRRRGGSSLACEHWRHLE